MAIKADADSRSTTWLVVVPIEQLVISDFAPIAGQWEVGDVVFRSRASLDAYLMPPNIEVRVAEPARDKFFGGASAFATVVRNGVPDQIRSTLFRDLVNATNILAATSAFHQRRHHQCGFAIRGYPLRRARYDTFIEVKGSGLTGNWDQQGLILPFAVDAQWHKSLFATGADKLFTRISDPALDGDWKRQICSAAAMLGKSLMSVDLADAFLLDVIGLETLLTKRDERNGKRLAKRIKGLAGWHLRINRPDYMAEIESVHRIRCDIVHDADYANLTVERLLAADLYLANALLNVVNLPNMFPNKAALVSVADSYAEKENWPTDVAFRWFGNQDFSHDDLKLDLW